MAARARGRERVGVGWFRRTLHVEEEFEDSGKLLDQTKAATHSREEIILPYGLLE